jgi:hypothetical protein
MTPPVRDVGRDGWRFDQSSPGRLVRTAGPCVLGTGTDVVFGTSQRPVEQPLVETGGVPASELLQ